MIFTRYTILIFFILFYVSYTEYLLFKNLLCGDIEINLGPSNRYKSISFYHWNINGLLARNCENFHLVEAFVVLNNIDIFCISETFLDSSVDNIYEWLNINGSTLVQTGHPSNTKCSVVPIYYKGYLPVIRRDNISSLSESIVLKIRLANNVSLSVYTDHLVKACSNINEEKPLGSIITEDFNARSENWWSQNMSNIHGSIIDALTSTSGYHQLINSTTHLTNTRSSCIYLSFFSNPSLITEFGIEGSLYTDSCHHSIVLGKMNLSDPLLPPYIREDWDYNKAEKKYPEKYKNLQLDKIVHKLNKWKNELLSNTLINIFRNYIPKKKVEFKYGEACGYIKT